MEILKKYCDPMVRGRAIPVGRRAVLLYALFSRADLNYRYCGGRAVFRARSRDQSDRDYFTRLDGPSKRKGRSTNDSKCEQQADDRNSLYRSRYWRFAFLELTQIYASRYGSGVVPAENAVPISSIPECEKRQSPPPERRKRVAN